MTAKKEDLLPQRTAACLDAVGAVLDEYIAFQTPEHRSAVVLWAAHTHVAGAFESTPRLAVLSAEPGSGKSRVLEILMELAPNSAHAVNLKPATMWRLIEHASPWPTFFVDEADTVFGRVGSGSSHVELRAILNAGHRKGALVPRCIGNQDVKMFETFAPVALAGLGTLPETIMTRSVVIRMKRAAPGQKVKPFRLRFAGGELAKVKDMLGAWGREAAPRLELAFPDMPVKDRAADVWEPLYSIADLAGEQWRALCDKACRKLTAEESNHPTSAGQALLRDLRDIYRARGHRQMFTKDVLTDLYALDSDTAWTPESFSAQTMGKVLREFDVAPTQLRAGAEVGRGYRAADLEDAWSRYLPGGGGPS